MWLKTGDFASIPVEDFVLKEIDPLQATIPVPILKELANNFTKNIFSVILYETLFEQNELVLFDKLIDSLQEKGIFVVSLGEHSPNSGFAQEILDKISNNKTIVTPALMTRFAHTSNPKKVAYAFRFKKKNVIKDVKAEKATKVTKTPKEAKKQTITNGKQTKNQVVKKKRK